MLKIASRGSEQLITVNKHRDRIPLTIHNCWDYDGLQNAWDKSVTAAESHQITNGAVIMAGLVVCAEARPEVSKTCEEEGTAASKKLGQLEKSNLG